MVANSALEIGIGTFIVGIILLLSGVAIRAGWWRTWYFLWPDVPIFAPKRHAYGMILGGVWVALIGVSFLLPPGSSASRTIDSIAMGWWLWVWVLHLLFRPPWIVPGWIRSLEAKHRDILDILIAETRRESKLRGKEWLKWACSDEGLEQWVAEVRQRYRLGRMQSWFHTLDRRYPHLDFETLVKVLGEAAGQEDATWAQRMQTEEDMTRWAEEVLRKRGLLKE